MADPRLEQERILPRLQRVLDVVSSWADRAPGARAANLPDMNAGPDMDDVPGVPNVNDVSGLAAVQTTVKSAGTGITAASADTASRSLAAASQALASSADGDDADTDRTHGSAAGTGRRHARATEPIWHMVTGQDARLPLPGMPAAVPRAPGSELPGDPGDPARAASAAHAAGLAPDTLAGARASEAMTTAVGMGHMSGNRAARSASGVSAAGSDAASDETDNAPGAARDATAPAQDAAVMQPLLGQETPPLFGRATTSGRAATASDTGAHATRAPSPHGAAGAVAVAAAGAPGTITGTPGAPTAAPGPAPWRASGHAAEPTPVPGHSSTLTGPVPSSLLHPPDLLGAPERGLARATPRSVPAEPQPHGSGAMPALAGAGAASPGELMAGQAGDSAGPAAVGSADRSFGRSELEEEIADVLEHAAREAGVDLS